MKKGNDCRIKKGGQRRGEKQLVITCFKLANDSLDGIKSGSVAINLTEALH